MAPVSLDEERAEEQICTRARVCARSSAGEAACSDPLLHAWLPLCGEASGVRGEDVFRTRSNKGGSGTSAESGPWDWFYTHFPRAVSSHGVSVHQREEAGRGPGRWETAARSRSRLGKLWMEVMRHTESTTTQTRTRTYAGVGPESSRLVWGLKSLWF